MPMTQSESDDLERYSNSTYSHDTVSSRLKTRLSKNSVASYRDFSSKNHCRAMKRKRRCVGNFENPQLTQRRFLESPSFPTGNDYPTFVEGFNCCGSQPRSQSR
ncbi:hypothetical protein MRX96_043612 [Rhipicephalus microplus]